MSQVNILKILKRNGKEWMTSKEIREKLKIGISATIAGLNKLFSQKLIFRRISRYSRGRGGFMYE